MSGEGESDDSTTIRRKILLSPTMPPRDFLDHSGSPLANLIGQVCLGHFAPLLVHNAVLDSVLNGMLACDQKLVTSRSIPISLRCSHSPVFFGPNSALTLSLPAIGSYLPRRRYLVWTHSILQFASLIRQPSPTFTDIGQLKRFHSIDLYRIPFLSRPSRYSRYCRDWHLTFVEKPRSRLLLFSLAPRSRL